MNSPLPIALRMTAADHLAAMRLHHWHAAGSSRNILLICGIAIATTVYFCFSEPQSIGQMMIVGTANIVVVIVFAAVSYLFISLILLPINSQRQFHEQPILNQNYMISWDERTYKVLGTTVRSEIPWKDYIKWQENESIILLYFSSRMYQVLPKHILEEEQLNEIRSRLEHSGVRLQRPLFG